MFPVLLRNIWETITFGLEFIKYFFVEYYYLLISYLI